MKKYRIFWQHTYTGISYVDAEDEEKAREKAELHEDYDYEDDDGINCSNDIMDVEEVQVI